MCLLVGQQPYIGRKRQVNSAVGRNAKNFRTVLKILHCIYAFRSILYAFRSLHPKITENLPINQVTAETEIRGDEF